MINLIILEADVENKEGSIFVSSEFKKLSYTEKTAILFDWICLLEAQKLMMKELEIKKIKDMP